MDVSEAGEVGASYTESPSTRLPVPIHLRAMPVDYFDVRFFANYSSRMVSNMTFAAEIMHAVADLCLGCQVCCRACVT